MRFGGNGYWLYLTRRALVVACVALMTMGAATASAADRYAVPSGGATAGACLVGSECTLEYAVEGAAQNGDTIWVAPGDYSVASPSRRRRRSCSGARVPACRAWSARPA